MPKKHQEKTIPTAVATAVAITPPATDDAHLSSIVQVVQAATNITVATPLQEPQFRYEQVLILLNEFIDVAIEQCSGSLPILNNDKVKPWQNLLLKLFQCGNFMIVFGEAFKEYIKSSADKPQISNINIFAICNLIPVFETLLNAKTVNFTSDFIKSCKHYYYWSIAAALDIAKYYLMALSNVSTQPQIYAKVHSDSNSTYTKKLVENHIYAFQLIEIIKDLNQKLTGAFPDNIMNPND